MELEQSSITFTPIADKRPVIPQPVPVRLVTVEDATLVTSAGLETELDWFYIDLLKFERDSKAGELVYRADNFRLRFDVVEMRPDREALRPLVIEVPALAEVEDQLIEREIDYSRQRGLMPGEERLVLRDPAGNWIEIGEYRRV